MTTNRNSIQNLGGQLRKRLASEQGMTLVEALVSALMVGLIGLTLLGLDAADHTSADQRRRAAATELAHSDQERIKGLSADQIATLEQTRTVTISKVPYTVTSSGKFISSSAGSASCSSSAAAADYAKVVTTVDWSSNSRPAVTEQSLITPRAGGSVIARVNDPTGAPLPGVSITASGTDQNTTSVQRRGTTDSDGCTIFGTLLPGDYSLAALRSGYVDPQGNSAPTSNITATSGNTSSGIFSMGQAGSLRASFTTKVNGSTLTGQRASAIMWDNTGLSTPGRATVASPASSIASQKSLYPFTTGTSSYTNNYSVWAGGCANDRPPTSVSYATVSPGATNAPATVSMPGMVLVVTENGSRVSPEHLRLTDACNDTWEPEIASNATTGADGVLKYPGQPYGGYTVCVDDTYPYYYFGRYYQLPFRGYANVANTNFSGTSKTIDIPITNEGYGSC